ncbi:MAG: hypothetical protein KC609_24230 [Myxococcales bacterium]|nr:hypothetical protein [Myxococcales bacterium]
MSQDAKTIVEQLGEAFDRFDKHELVALLNHVVKTYVLEGARALKPELALIDPPKHLRDLNFPQLVAQLKAHLDLPELNLFSVVGNDVYVNISGDRQLLTNEAANPNTPRDRAADPPPRSTTQSAPPPSSGAPGDNAPASGRKEPDAFGGTSDDANRFSMLDWD